MRFNYYLFKNRRLFFLIAMMGTRLGIETLASLGEILFPWLIRLFLMLVIFITPQIELRKIQPILENGMKPLLQSTIFFLSLSWLIS